MTAMKWIIVFTVIPSFFMFAYTVSRNFFISQLAATGMIVGLTVLGYIPLWLAVLFGVLNLGFFLITGGALNVPNQLVQKRKDENRNLCKNCMNRDVCEDYKRLKYADVCESFAAIFEYKCPQCGNNSSRWVEINSDGTVYECSLCKTQFFRDGRIHVRGNDTMACPLCQSPMSHECNGDVMVWNCRNLKCGYKSSRIGSFGEVETKLVKPLEVSIKIEKTLPDKLQEAKFDRGVKTYNNLKSEYEGVLGLFSGKVNTTLIDTSKVKKTTEEIYKKSLDFLNLGLELYKQLNVTDYENLKAEIGELESSLENFKDTTSASYRILREALDKKNQMLGLMKKNKEKIDELFGQISLCKDAIMEIRLGLPELLYHQSADEVDKVIADGRERLNFGQRLLEEFKREGL